MLGLVLQAEGRPLPESYQKGGDTPVLMPSDDTLLAIGDRMVVLATSIGLRRIEQGRASITPKNWRVQVDKALTQEAIFEGANASLGFADVTSAPPEP